MASDWRAAVVEQLEWYWTAMFRPRLEGLGDQEYLWEPVEGCWTVRRAGDGRAVLDWQFPEPDPPPFTTIAWRLCHLARTMAQRASFHFGDASVGDESTAPPLDARAAVELVGWSFEAWRSGVEAWRSAAEEDERPGRSGSSDDLAGVLVHMNREVIHHAAEVALLRDLYRGARGGSSDEQGFGRVRDASG